MAPRRPPTHTVTVMSRSSERPLVVMLLSAKRACDSMPFCSDTMASSAPGALGVRQHRVANLQGRVSGQHHSAAVFRTVMLRKRAGGHP